MNPSNFELWAKGERSDGATPPSVLKHCCDVYEVADALWDAGEAMLADATKEDRAQLRLRLRSLYLVAAVLHDVMKSNSAFQAVVRQHANNLGQPVRHEVLAAVLMMDDQFWGKWFRNGLNERERWMVAWAVAGHHLQLRRRTASDRDDPIYRTSNVLGTIKVFSDHLQVMEVLRKVRAVLHDQRKDPGDVPEIGSRSFDVLDETETGLEQMVRQFLHNSEKYWKRWRNDEGYRRDLALLKALLIAADVAGSALPVALPDGESLSKWVPEKLNSHLDISQLDRIIADNLDGRQPRAFQERVAANPHPVTVVTAGCGNGKTTAAYMWACQWAVGRKLFFTYPTTGTASAGFRDYLLLQPGLRRMLIHGRADVDLDVMMGSDDVPPIERAQRLESLNAWGQEAIACTVDTVLGLIQNQRRPLFSFPAILKGAFVFDEVHSYDRRMFAALLQFLTIFPGVPALIMSVSIPPKRLQALKDVADGRMNPEPISGERALEEIERYQLHERTKEDCWEEVSSLCNRSRAVTRKLGIDLDMKGRFLA